MNRYIDADVLKDKMFNYYDCVNRNTGKGNYKGETLMNYEVADMIEDCIGNAPTADVQEVKRGYWTIRYEGAYKRARCYCSVCRKPNGISGIIGNQKKPYCPNCGAKMGLEEDGT